jgi:hypothetical protein
MKARIASTDQIVTVKAIGFDGQTKARVWEGVTETGVRFTAYIPIVQVHKDDDNSQFERELSEHKQPEDWTRRAIDARMIL